MSDKKGELKKKVLEFVKDQPGYDKKKHELLDAFCDDEDIYMVVYGDSIITGIAGSGHTVDLAFKDFVKYWKQYNGFVWIEKNR